MKFSITTKAIFLLFLIAVQHTKVLADENDKTKVEEVDIHSQKSGDFSKEDLQKLEASQERHEFQTEVGRLMDIIINSLYTQKEIFLREVISNASDALDKLRFLSVSNPDILGDKPELEIRVEYDKEQKTISIYDSGIGMTKQDLINNLGTIAKSGSTNFIEAIKGGNLNLIGQFGVGFYSTFLAGTKVQVTSKNNDDKQHVWESSAAHSFTLAEDPRGDTLKRGTKVTIFLKQDAEEFCEEDRIKNLIKKYSEFINFPIYLRTQKEVSREVPDESEDASASSKTEEEEKKTEEGAGDAEKKEDDLEVKEEAEKKEEKKPKMKTIKEKTWEWVLVNEAKAIWLRNKEEIEDEEYHKFYKSLTKDYDDPLQYIHFKAEGEVEFRSILFIPKRAPYDLYENYYGKSSSLKLYVRRVLINEEFEELMPRYLNFIKGVVDSDELPLNVSRETLQQLKMMKVISRKLVRKAIEMIKKLAETKKDDEDDEEEEEGGKDVEDEEGGDTEEDKKEDEKSEDEKQKEKQKKKEEKQNKYLNFYKEFGKNIKLGIIEDPGNRNKLAKLTRWYSSMNTTELISFDEYIARAKKGQDYIYFIAGDDRNQLMKSPIIQNLLKKGYEVLLLDDPIDEFCFQHLNEYEKKKLVNVAKGEFKFPDDDDSGRKRIKKLKKIYQPLIDWWRKVMGDILENVHISQRLVEDPCVIVSTEHGQSANLEKISRAQAYTSPERQQMNSGQKKLLEINPSHPLIKELLERVKDNPDTETEEYARMLTETALVNSGYQLTNANDFAKRFYKLFNGAMGIAKDAPIEEIDINLDEDDEDEPKKSSEDSGNAEEGSEAQNDDSNTGAQEEEETKTKDDL